MVQGLDVKRLRDDFPALQRPGAEGRPPIYFDNAAGTIPPRQVIASMTIDAINKDPDFDELRDEQRFRALLERIERQAVD